MKASMKPVYSKVLQDEAVTRRKQLRDTAQHAKLLCANTSELEVSKCNTVNGIYEGSVMCVLQCKASLH